jgi:L-fuconate dehydratase
MFDYTSVSTSMEDRVIEYVDHLHEHFVDPVRIRDAAYVVPTVSGASADLHAETFGRFAYPTGTEWR